MQEEVFTIDGMTCANCVAKVQSALENHPGVVAAEVKLEHPQARIEFRSKVGLKDLQSNLIGYRIQPYLENKDVEISSTPNTYKPLMLIVSFIFGVSLLAQFPFSDFDITRWMGHFMAGFFIVFSFFKILNLKGFADTYKNYDIVAGKWYSWGLIYPFIELSLGILYLINYNPLLTNILTIIILGVSSIGVIQSNLQKKKIKCACLGDFFNLPMSTVTIIEDVGMVLMAVLMLL